MVLTPANVIGDQCGCVDPGDNWRLIVVITGGCVDLTPVNAIGDNW